MGLTSGIRHSGEESDIINWTDNYVLHSWMSRHLADYQPGILTPIDGKTIRAGITDLQRWLRGRTWPVETPALWHYGDKEQAKREDLDRQAWDALHGLQSLDPEAGDLEYWDIEEQEY